MDIALINSSKKVDAAVSTETAAVGQKLSLEAKAEAERTAIFLLEQEEAALKQYQAFLKILRKIDPPIRPNRPL